MNNIKNKKRMEIKSSDAVEFMMMFLLISIAPLMMLDFTTTQMVDSNSNKLLGFITLSIISILILIYMSILLAPEFRELVNFIKVLEFVFSILLITTMYTLSIHVIATAFLY